MRSPRLDREAANRSRLYALPAARTAGDVVVAGVSLAARDAALDKLDHALFIGVPAALLLASFAAYMLAARGAGTGGADADAARPPFPPTTSAPACRCLRADDEIHGGWGGR